MTIRNAAEYNALYNFYVTFANGLFLWVKYLNASK